MTRPSLKVVSSQAVVPVKAVVPSRCDPFDRSASVAFELLLAELARIRPAFGPSSTVAVRDVAVKAVGGLPARAAKLLELMG
jgi:hypothetical protein